MKISITSAQYSALESIYGPPESVHYMIMTSTLVDGKWILDGNYEDFEALLSVISEEIGEGSCSQADAKHLLTVCRKVDPDSVAWIGA